MIRSSFRYSALGALSLALLAACSGQGSQPDGERSLPDPSSDPAGAEASLDQEGGGLDANDTAPAFGDPAVDSMVGFTDRFADQTDMLADATGAMTPQSVPGAPEPANEPAAHVYKLAVFWGHLPTPRDAEDTESAPQVMNWTGSISVDQGGIALKKTLRFDGEDSVTPRTDRKKIEFKSLTLPHVDGVYLHIALPADAPQVVHFATDSLTTDIDLTTLGPKAGGVTRLDDNRNSMAYLGYEDAPNCAKGLLVGHWIKVRPALGGFRGHVIGDQGQHIGHIKGIWGHARRINKNVFFGKYINDQGTHRGLFGGQYGQGEFKGVWGTRDPNNVGTLDGFYSDGYEKGDGRGVYLGRWSERCPR